MVARCHSVKCRCALLAVATSFTLFLATPLVAQQMMQVVQTAPGFQAVSSFQNFGNGESVNLANGGLTVTHPSAIALPQNRGGMLQPVRVYNSKDQGLAWGTADLSKEAVHGALGVGWAQPFGPAPYGDDPADQTQIKAGENYYYNNYLPHVMQIQLGGIPSLNGVF